MVVLHSVKFTNEEFAELIHTLRMKVKILQERDDPTDRYTKRIQHLVGIRKKLLEARNNGKS